MVRLRPPGEGERLCTPWVLLSDLEILGIVTFENFSGYFEVHLSGRVRHWTAHAHTPVPPARGAIPNGCSLALFCTVVSGRWCVDDGAK